LDIRHILETHVHADFVSGARELKARLQGRPIIHCSGDGGSEWTPLYADHVVKDGDDVKLGSLRLRGVHTPGHTPEHIAWALYDDSRSCDTPWVMFTGDFLFVGDVGRPDLLGEEARQHLARQLHQTLFERLPAIPDLTEIYPAHGAGSLCGKALSSRRSSTVGFERRCSPALVHKPLERWVADLMTDMPAAPPYFRRMKQVNKEGPKVLGLDWPGQKAVSSSEMSDEWLILDVRPQDAFATGHIEGSINIPLSPSLPTWAGTVLPYHRPILLVLDNPRQLAEVSRHLIRVGFDDIHGYLADGVDGWKAKGHALTKLPTFSVQQLAERLTRDRQRFTVVDVRTDKEWKGGHIGGAMHVHGGHLLDRFGQVPRDRPVAVVCASGYRSSVAASFLKRQGYQDVANVSGGMTAWQAAGLPTATG
jgi:hydroxyacylglutathione hydrolase